MPPKICVACGQDCSGKPRTKDPRGQYYCQECYDRRKAELEVSGDTPQVPLEAIIPPESATWPPAVDANLAPPPIVEHRCPHCGQPVAPDAVLCTQCGFARNTETQFQTGVEQVDDRDSSSASVALLALWLVVRPSRFYRAIAAKPFAVFTVLTTLTVGLAAAIDRIGLQQFRAELRGEEFFIPNNWAAHWGMIGLVGAFGSAWIYAIGGWWYRRRIMFCGVADPDPVVARRMYMSASLLYALPLLIVTIGETIAYATPNDAYLYSSAWLAPPIIGCIFWSVWSSFIGIRAVFDGVRWMVVLWFGVLPTVWYATCLGGAFAAGIVLALAGPGAPPDLINTQRHSSSNLSFEYPGNWFFDQDDPSTVYVEAWQNAWVEVMWYQSERTVQEEMRASIDSATIRIDFARVSSEFEHWGDYDGEGRVVIGSLEGFSMTVRIFVGETPSGAMLEVWEWSDDQDSSMVDNGFELIRATLTAR